MRTLILAALVLASPSLAAAQQDDNEWLENCRHRWNRDRPGGREVAGPMMFANRTWERPSGAHA